MAGRKGIQDGILSALTFEYVDGKNGAVGAYIDSGAATAGVDIDRLEDRVRDANNPRDEISRIRAEFSRGYEGKTRLSKPKGWELDKYDSESLVSMAKARRPSRGASN